MTLFVPYLSDEAIERDAEALLAEYAQARGITIKPPIPVDAIAEKHLRLTLEFDDTHELFGVPRPGFGLDPDILGAIFFDDARIVIDESLDPEENREMEGRFRFTLAHEVAHWRLHRHLFGKGLAPAALRGRPEVPSVLCRASQAKERVEWQADFHSSCVIMPRTQVFEAWRAEFGTCEPIIFDPGKHGAAMFRRRSNRLRSVGEILHEMTRPEHARFFDQIAKRFAPVFCVSPQAMRIRLEKLGLLRSHISRRRILTADAWPPLI